ncbi:MAG: YdiY family protein [Nitrospiria bacterium]
MRFISGSLICFIPIQRYLGKVWRIVLIFSPQVFFLIDPLLGFGIVNIEAIRSEATQKGFSGHFELSVNGRSGNTDKITTHTATRFQWHQNKHTGFAVLRYAYGESAGNRDTNKTFLHARYIHKMSPGRSEEAFIQGESDEFARLSFRGLAGAGLRFQLSNHPRKQTAYLGTGAFYVVESLEARPGTTDARTEQFWRFNTYLSYQRRLNENVHFISTTYYQPAIENFSDYRILEEAGFTISMTDQLKLNLSLDIIHDSKPPQSVEKTDVTYRTGIEYAF